MSSQTPRSPGQPQTCQEEACALQGCLSRNVYRPEKCDEYYVRKLYLCCLEMYKLEGDNAESTACPAKAVMERWWKKSGDDSSRERST